MIKTYTQNIKDIRSKEDFRLSSNYYYLNVWFDKLSNSGWEIINLKDICESIGSGSYVKGYVDKPIKYYIRVGDIKRYVIDESEMKYVKSAPERALLEKDEIFFGRTQATFSKLGVFSITTERLASSATSQHVAKIRLLENSLDPYYLVAYLNSKFGKAQMVLASYGDTRVEFTNSQIAQIRVVKIPNDDMSSIISLTKEITELNENELLHFRKAQEILNSKFKEFEISSPKEENVSKTMLIENDLWTPTTYKKEFVHVRNIIKDNIKFEIAYDVFKKIGRGKEVGSKNYRVELEKTINCRPFIRTSDIYNSEVDIYPDYFFDSNDDDKIKLPILKNNQILFSKDGKIGQTAIVNENDDYIPSSGFLILEVKPEYNPNYIFALLANERILKYQAMMKTVIATTLPHLKEDKFSKILIPIFDEETQVLVSNEIEEYRKCIIEKTKICKKIDGIFDKYYERMC